MKSNWFKSFATACALSVLCAGIMVGSVTAQNPQSNPTNPALAAFAQLPPTVQRFLLSRANDFAQDAQTPGAWQQSTQGCLHLGPGQLCESLSGSSGSIGFAEGLQVAIDRNASGQTALGGGVEFTSPGFVGATGQATYFPTTGNSQFCAGPAGGILPVLGGSVQECFTLDHQRAQEIREAIAYGQQMERNRQQLFIQQDAERTAFEAAQREANRAADLEMRRQIAARAYNPPADMIAPYSAANPGNQIAPASSPNGALTQPSGDGNGMTQEQFRAQMERVNREFQAAEATNRRNPLNIPVPTTNQTPPIGDVPPAGVRPQTNYNEYAPRNGYDAYGNREDSPRRSYDDNGYAAQPRENRVYSSDGSSRPIGSQTNRAAQQFQAIYQQSQAQIAAQQANRANDYSSAINSDNAASSNRGQNTSSNSVATNSGPATATANNGGSYQSGSRIVMDDNAPRSAPTALAPRTNNGTNASQPVSSGANVNRPRATPSTSSVLDEAPQRPLGGSTVYDHRPGQSGAVQVRPAGRTQGTAQTTTEPVVTRRAAGTSSATASLRLGN